MHTPHTGRIQFHAPKAAGQFVYRLFDQSTKEKTLCTIGTSPLLIVRIYDFEVTSNLRFCYDSFEEKAYLKATSQLQAIIIGMCNSGKQTRRDCPRQLLQNCVKSMLDLIDTGINVLDLAKEREKDKKDKHLKNEVEKSLKEIETEIETETENEVETEIEKNRKNDLKKTLRKEEETLLRQVNKIQTEVHDTLVALRQNDIAASLLFGTYCQYILLMFFI